MVKKVVRHSKTKSPATLHSVKTSTAKSSKKPFSTTTKALLGIVGACMICVLIAAFACLNFTPEREADRALHHLAYDYYTDYLYPDILGDHIDDPASVLADYIDSGLPVVRLRQLLLRNSETRSYIHYFSSKSYSCDTNATTLRFYPYAPYGPRDYKVAISYDCRDLTL